MDEIDRSIKKTLGFRPSTNYISPECITSLHNMKDHRELSKFASQACQFLYDYEFYRKGFLIRIIESNFSLCKHILRNIGRSLKL